MELAAGRETDFILTPDHRFVAGAALTNFIDPGVSKLQLVQGCETRLTIRYVRTQHFSANTLSNLRQQMADAISPQLAYEFVEVDDIPLQASGKIQYVHSEVARRRLAIHN